MTGQHIRWLAAASLAFAFVCASPAMAQTRAENIVTHSRDERDVCHH